MGKMHGEGKYDWGDGRVYRGHYKWDKKDGYGEYDFGNGVVYKGQWKDNKQHGKGTVFMEDGR